MPHQLLARFRINGFRRYPWRAAEYSGCLIDLTLIDMREGTDDHSPAWGFGPRGCLEACSGDN